MKPVTKALDLVLEVREVFSKKGRSCGGRGIDQRGEEGPSKHQEWHGDQGECCIVKLLRKQANRPSWKREETQWKTSLEKRERQRALENLEALRSIMVFNFRVKKSHQQI